MLWRRRFCENPYDARQVDVDGNVWTGVGDGVYVYSASGELLGAVTIGEVSNLAFAGDTLIMLQARPQSVCSINFKGFLQQSVCRA